MQRERERVGEGECERELTVKSEKLSLFPRDWFIYAGSYAAGGHISVPRPDPAGVSSRWRWLERADPTPSASGFRVQGSGFRVQGSGLHQPAGSARWGGVDAELGGGNPPFPSHISFAVFSKWWCPDTCTTCGKE